jgi:hypothetical protein
MSYIGQRHMIDGLIIHVVLGKSNLKFCKNEKKTFSIEILVVFLVLCIISEKRIDIDILLKSGQEQH